VVCEFELIERVISGYQMNKLNQEKKSIYRIKMLVSRPKVMTRIMFAHYFFNDIIDLHKKWNFL